MTGARAIKWLTVLMLALSVAIAGAWVWAVRVRLPTSHMTLRSVSFPILKSRSGYLTITPSTRQLPPDFELIDDAAIVVTDYVPPAPCLGGQSRLGCKHLREVSVEFRAFAPDVSDGTRRDISDDQILLLGKQYTVEMGDAVMRRRFDDGLGLHSRIYWPGVAQRVRMYSPWALGVTGALTVAGLAAMAIQRRRVRRRAEQQMCVQCGYDLRGIEGDVCPECGEVAAQSRV